MLLKKGIIHSKKIKAIIISISALLVIFVAGHYLLSYMGFIYLKNDEGKKVYEFIEDMNGDGKKENVKFINHYYSYYLQNASDSEYTSNNIDLYLDGEKIYSSKISTLAPLLNPQIVDLVENNTKRKQILAHANGGGSAVPMDYFFYLDEGKILVNRVKSGY